MDERRIAQIESWLDEDYSSDDLEDDASSNDEEDFLEVQDHQSESEQEEETPNEVSTVTVSELGQDDSSQVGCEEYYIGVDNTRWSKTAPSNRGRTRSHNIVFVPPGPKGIAREKGAAEDCISLFLDDVVIDLIVKYTNIKIEHIKQKYARERDAKLTDSTEVKAFLGKSHTEPCLTNMEDGASLQYCID
ncbi:unnamed protein product [Parnassius apollo]|uniref:(apollo) hypothetical protein n=1 Tax=Parnassius apollo TaxID=110799 RepID=A0A8S3YAM7_PARAO|nr:unnamed protein product [Parnassius apollo]